MEIRIENLNFSYSKLNYYPREIFNDLNVNLTSNVDAIIGPNGVGKTTLLDLISGEIKNYEGEIIIPDSKIGYVKEDMDFVSNTVYEELKYSMQSHDLRSNDKKIFDSLIMVGLDLSLVNKKINDLNLIEKRKLQIAIELIINPKILLIDNITVELTMYDKKQLIRIIKMLKNRYDKKIIICSNDIEFVHKIAERVYVIYDKKLVLEGTKYDVFKEEELLKKYDIISPNIIKFENMTYKNKNVKLGYRDEINDLIKDIYRCL